ncbi:MucR family transcriptional regulator [Gluconacetobacter diazotrophicus]|uniref:MucR family transcriptional regulator n=1 Tax=Gluconacetobacter diazotrophicus TaxID=33996 RepID=A0A7W4I517_GLUDI|nr:MucR family transcriptional regulator [Gluconacetobacter diazotrophicus]MBB2156572.1 MucR family transcriptional regulator [Gluconacetobacter diazotrophicus]
MSDTQSAPTSNPAPAKELLLSLTASIVSGYVGRNAIQPDTVPNLIRAVYETLVSAGRPAESTNATAPTPAVPIKRSVFPDYIVCLEDGKKLKMLKRHLSSAYGMTPGQYRERWGLPADYPMVAPNYATRRSELARASGLGQKAGDDIGDAASAGTTEPPAERDVVTISNDPPSITVLPERRRGRRKTLA